MKVQWRGQPVEKATWETEREMQSRYSHLSETSGMFLDMFGDEGLFKRGECNDPADRFESCSLIPTFTASFMLYSCYMTNWVSWFGSGGISE